jgi:hypothetical protein
MIPSFNLGGPFSGIAGQLSRITETVTGAHTAEVQEAAVLLLAAIREELSKPGSGRVYRIPVVKRDGTLRKTKKGATSYRTHRASAPGEPPAVDTGELRRGSTMGIVGGKMRVGVTAKYGPYLDRGTPRVKPRPFMAPALARATPAMSDVIVDALREEATHGFF